MVMRGIKRVAERLPGYRYLGESHERTDWAIQFDYYGWRLWLPRKAVIYARNEKRYCAPRWAIETAKEHGSARASD
jgi:hypothetical protein